MLSACCKIWPCLQRSCYSWTQTHTHTHTHTHTQRERERDRQTDRQRFNCAQYAVHCHNRNTIRPVWIKLEPKIRTIDLIIVLTQPSAYIVLDLTNRDRPQFVLTLTKRLFSDGVKYSEHLIIIMPPTP